MQWLAGIWNWLKGVPSQSESNIDRRAESALQTQEEDSREKSRPATWGDVANIAKLLRERSVEYVLVGGYALQANGIIRNTNDIDILVNNSPENNKNWIAALSMLPDGAAKELDGEDDPFPYDPEEYDGPSVLRIYDEIIVDVMPRTCGLSYTELKAHFVQVETSSGPITVLDLHGLLKTKQSPRAKDVSDREMITIALSKSQDNSQKQTVQSVDKIISPDFAQKGEPTLNDQDDDPNDVLAVKPKGM
jgi:hypothetical protein